MKCWNCGTQNQKTNKVCKKCGSDLTQPEMEEPAQERYVQPWVWALLGVAGMLIVGILLIVLLNLFSGNQKSASRQAAAAIEATAVLDVAVDSSENDGADDQQSTDSDAAAVTLSVGSAQGEGCDWSTCAWMEQDQCETCGGTWSDFGDEAYCDCSAEKWQSQELEWCKFEGGSWLEDEGRCTFLNPSNSANQAEFVSACADLYYNNQTTKRVTPHSRQSARMPAVWTNVGMNPAVCRFVYAPMRIMRRCRATG